MAFRNKKRQTIQDSLEILNQYPPRDPSMADARKSKFLAQAKMIKKSSVTNAPEKRHSKWNSLFTKERKMGTLLTILITLGLVFGGSTATVYASQSAVPEEFFYPVKTLTEDIQLDLSSDPETTMELALEFALRRVDEISELKEAGLLPPDAVYARLENQLNLAIGQAVSLGNGEAEKALLKIEEMLRTREQLMEQDADDPILLRTRTLLQDRIQLIQSGMANPSGNYNEYQSGWENTPGPSENTGGAGNGQNGPEVTPGSDNSNPDLNSTPTNGTEDAGGQIGNPTQDVTPGSSTGQGTGGSGKGK